MYVLLIQIQVAILAYNNHDNKKKTILYLVGCLCDNGGDKGGAIQLNTSNNNPRYIYYNWGLYSNSCYYNG